MARKFTLHHHAKCAFWKGDVTDSPILITDWGKTQPDDYHGDHGKLSGQDCLSLFGDDYRDPHDWFRFDDNHCDLHKAGLIYEKPVQESRLISFKFYKIAMQKK